MEWRCEWCGKPHESDDPPCDNCGNGQFERAVRPVAPEGEGGPTVWICTECGRDHPRNNPPCSRCGGMELEKREQTYEEGDAIGPGVDVGGAESDEDPGTSGAIGGDTMLVWACTECGRTHPRNNPPCSRCGGMTMEQRERSFEDVGELDSSSFVETGDSETVDESAVDVGDATASADESTTVWACTECGRGHTRNNPPCSRCGNMQLERRVEHFDDVAPTAGGWLQALDLKVVLGFLGAFVLLALLVGTSLGIVTLPGMAPSTIPAEDVPGEAEMAHGLDLASVERAYVAELNDRRAAAGMATLERSSELDQRATWYNRRTVQAAAGDASPPSMSELDGAFPDANRCSDTILVVPDRVPGGLVAGSALDEYDSESALAVALVDEYEAEYDGEFTEVSNGFVGVDVHVGDDDTVFVTLLVC